ncbi:transglutaminase domain-containing protein [Pseudoalteromonas nigrifaciens]|uniref:transglutaminase domain-containing protein n=1 Tax=Pseudoalteromonas nigrifaciens TaxID=28109 RepID=UPI0017882F9D|nr:transglutaminase-like domain-containing protein [Pseudoalteromonas nigrifaciens]MBE0421764.1 hypothetical protein [Pseudoalteromonas nigrifaciens]
MKLLNKVKDILAVFGTQVLIIFLFIEVNLKKRISTLGMLLIFGLANILLIFFAVGNKPLFSAAIRHAQNLDSDVFKEQFLAYVFISILLSIIYGVTFLYTSLTRKMLIRHKIINTLGYEAWKKVDEASVYLMLKEELKNNNKANLSILGVTLVVIILLFICFSKNTKLEKAISCIENKEDISALSNFNADLSGVNRAINESSELGECLVDKLELLKTGTDIDKAQSVLDFVRNSISYKVDISGTRLPSKTIVDGEGDCEDMTALSGTLLKSLGVDFYLIERKALGQDKLGHIYAAIESDKYTGVTCGDVNLDVIDATDGQATVGIQNNNGASFEFKCRLIASEL